MYELACPTSLPIVPGPEWPGEGVVESIELVGGVSELKVSLNKELVSLLVKLMSFLSAGPGWVVTGDG